MTTTGELHFLKMEGCGNSFIVIFEAQGGSRDWAALGRRLMDPHFGLGSDGLMIVHPSERADFEVLMYNPDGSQMGMCGNGIRCVARFLILEGLLEARRGRVVFDVAGRLITCRLEEEGRWAQVDMGEPSLAPGSIPVNSAKELIDAELVAGGRRLNFSAVSMGNPHCVIFVEKLTDVNCCELGPLIENHALFPERTNVEFVEVLESRRLRVQVWERGAGLTLGCGTGACAAVVVGVLRGLCARQTTVDLPGGSLSIEWEEKSNRVFMTGPAKEICRGTFYPQVLAGYQ